MIDLSTWKSIEVDGLPPEKVLVDYYFEHTGVGTGFYEKTWCEELKSYFDCFVGAGFL